MKAFVTDGDQRSALAITRSLGRRGIRVLVGEERPESLASCSRYCAGHVTYPSPYREAEPFRRFLVEVVRRQGVDVVIPVTDVTTWSVCRDQDRLRRHTTIAVPSFDAFDQVTDKSSLMRSADRQGIRIPRTLFVDGISDLDGIVEGVEYPAVVKPSRSKILTNGGWVAAGVHYAESAADLRRLYEQTDYLASHPSLIQQRIAGPGVGVFAVFDRGELLTVFAHERLREKPPSGGVSVLCQSVAVDPRLRDDAQSLLGPLGWHGVAMLEYKRDRATGKHFLIEVNGRFWGSLQLAVDAGVDFPYLSWQLAQGLRPAVPSTYRVGVKNRWLLGDLDHLLSRLFTGRDDLGLPDDAPSRLRTVLDFLSSTSRGGHDQVARGDDPAPFRYELRRYAASLRASLTGRAGRGAARSLPRGLRFARRTIPT